MKSTHLMILVLKQIQNQFQANLITATDFHGLDAVCHQTL